MKWEKMRKQDKLVRNLKSLWENDHAEEIAESYNKIVEILAGLDTYSANMVVNLMHYQTLKKTFESTVGKKEIGGEKDG